MKYLAQSRTPQTVGSTLSTVLIIALSIAALYFARDVLIPITLAILLSFVLAPLVRFLRRWYLPRALAVLLSVLLAFGIIFSFGSLLFTQVTQLASDLPRYQSTLREKIKSLRGATAGTETLERASAVLKELGKELDRPHDGKQPQAAPDRSIATSDKPIPVEIRVTDPGAFETIVSFINPLIHPLTTTGLVIIFVIFILMQREDLRNRLVRLVGAKDLQHTTAALGDAGKRLSRLFLTQLALNAGFGLVIGTGLWLIGVPSAPLWGMLAMVLRFVPYIGALISAVFPVILAAAVGPDWSMALWTAGLFLIVEPITGHIIEPMLYGQSAGLSPIAVVASAAFWTWLWGPVGLVLATPLTMCLVVLGRHVDRLNFLDVMLGDEPALRIEELTYQRMLAGDPIEATEQARQFLKEKPLLNYYQDVLIEALKLAQADADRGHLDEERKQRIRDVIAEMLEDLETHEDKIDLLLNEGSIVPDALTKTLTTVASPEQEVIQTKVLCIPGRDLLGEAFALIVAQLLVRQGIGANAERSGALSTSRLSELETRNVELVCLCFLGNATKAQIHYAARRLHRRIPHAAIVVTLVGETNHSTEDLSAVEIHSIQYSVAETLDEILRIVGSRVQPEPLGKNVAAANSRTPDGAGTALGYHAEPAHRT